MDKSPVILIVDDNEDNRVIYSTMLRYRGFQVLEADTGEEGLVLATEHRPDLILLDINLPGITGLEVFEMLRRDARTARTPVFAVTAYGHGDELRPILAAGFDRVVTKPIEPRHLLETLHDWFGMSA
jgi:two-component system cell cycle response regulator DivK